MNIGRLYHQIQNKLAMERNIKCGGVCCRYFTLPFSQKEIFEKALKFEAGNGDSTEFIKIAAAFVPILESKLLGNRYFCLMLNEVTGLCDSYENRPEVCRDFPHGRKCERCGFE